MTPSSSDAHNVNNFSKGKNFGKENDCGKIGSKEG